VTIVRLMVVVVKSSMYLSIIFISVQIKMHIASECSVCSMLSSHEVAVVKLV